MMKKLYIILVCMALVSSFPKQVHAIYCCATCECTICAPFVEACSQICGACSSSQEENTKNHFTAEMENHQQWMVEFFFLDAERGDPAGLLAAMMLMADQLTANAMLQVQIIGSLFDAKHQLETQRLFQTLTARAHKDYHPSQELCEVGTAARSLTASERRSDLVAKTFSKRAVDRQLLSINTTGHEKGEASDERSRLVQFIKRFCNPNDNVGQLDLLCSKGSPKPENYNRDINYTTSVDLPLTLEINLDNSTVTDDEAAFFALTANLIGHQAMPAVPAEILMSKDRDLPAFSNAAVAYLDSRALVAKRSVAANSLSSIMSLKAEGTTDSQPFIYSVMREMIPNGDISFYLGDNPSYYAQMEVLTKKLYQHPNFFSDLYDKPANVLRKDVAIQAADLMQKRDIFRSLLRSEAVLAVMLETALLKEQDKVTNEVGKSKEGGGNTTDIGP